MPEALSFRVLSSSRLCCGWYDVEHEGRHVVCEGWRSSDRGQCPACSRREGFAGAHHAHEAATLPPRIRVYLGQPHLVYVAAFADGSRKVGTVAESRLSSRVSEQGPVAAAYVARSPDGIAARRVEAEVARSLGLRQRVGTMRKLRALGTQIDVTVATTRLREAAIAASEHVAGHVAADDAHALDPPHAWELPDEARRAFDATPAEPYPRPLAEGAHHLRLVGLAGTVAVFTTPSDEQRIFAADLNELRGREIEIGDHAALPEEAGQQVLL